MTVAEKLDTLYQIQQLDSQVDKIEKIKGDLPDEVQDLEDEIAGYETRIRKFEEDIKEQEVAIGKLKQAIKDAEKLVTKYEDQQMNVRNNREYDAITKEIEMQKLDIQLFEKRIREAGAKIDKKKEDIQKIQDILDERKKDLEAKQEELKKINEESKSEQAELEKKKEKTFKKLDDERLARAYKRIRNNVRNGLAVVNVQRGACGGCFAMVPPQRQADIKEKKKLIVCEHCGRIFSGVEDPPEPEPKKKKRKKRSTKKKKAKSKS